MAQGNNRPLIYDKVNGLTTKSVFGLIASKAIKMKGRGSAFIVDPDLDQYAVTEREHEAIIRGFVNGRRLAGKPAPTEQEVETVVREFALAKLYPYILHRLVHGGQYTLDYSVRDGFEIRDGDADTEAEAQALEEKAKGPWKPEWELVFKSEIHVLADTPEEAIEKANRSISDIKLSGNSKIIGMAFSRPEPSTLRLNRFKNVSTHAAHAAQWDAVEAKYPEYVKPRED